LMLGVEATRDLEEDTFHGVRGSDSFIVIT